MKDLEWLARNVPVDVSYGLVERDEIGFTDCSYTGYSSNTYTKAEVDAERELLVNRPKFEDHHRAKCFVQSPDGIWSANNSMKDLEWLARNVTCWLDDEIRWPYISKHCNCAVYSEFYLPNNYTKAEVDAERTRLINRPSFDDQQRNSKNDNRSRL